MPQKKVRSNVNTTANQHRRKTVLLEIKQGERHSLRVELRKEMAKM